MPFRGKSAQVANVNFSPLFSCVGKICPSVPEGDHPHNSFPSVTLWWRYRSSAPGTPSVCGWLDLFSGKHYGCFWWVTWKGSASTTTERFWIPGPCIISSPETVLKTSLFCHAYLVLFKYVKVENEVMLALEILLSLTSVLISGNKSVSLWGEVDHPK